MIDKIKAGWKVLKAGEVVANPVAWKRGQITAAYLTTFLSSVVVLVRTLGYELPVTDEQLSAIATVVLLAFSAFNHFATVASTDKIDTLGRTPVQPVVPASIITSTENTSESKQLGRYPPTPDTPEVQDDLRNTMGRDSSLG